MLSPSCATIFLACSRVHFDRVVDRLKPLSGINYDQGLDARVLTEYHAHRLAELDCKVRLAWDSVSYESSVVRAVERLRRAGFIKRAISIYVLIGFKDTPEDALYRLRTIRDMGYNPFPMRYQPLDTPKKNSFVGEGWTHGELVRYMRYWSNLRYVGGVPFEEFVNNPNKIVSRGVA